MDNGGGVSVLAPACALCALVTGRARKAQALFLCCVSFKEKHANVIACFLRLVLIFRCLSELLSWSKGLVGDAFALATAGLTPVVDVLQFLLGFVDETDYTVPREREREKEWRWG